MTAATQGSPLTRHQAPVCPHVEPKGPHVTGSLALRGLRFMSLSLTLLISGLPMLQMKRQRLRDMKGPMRAP